MSRARFVMPARTPTIDWPARATELAASIPRARLHPAVLDWTEAAGPRAAWGIGFSGGPDSLALLLLLWAHWPEHRRRLRALHFDHRLRGVESTADAAFCRRVCRALGVTFVAGRWAKARRGASEAEARTARMAFFKTQSRVIWLGHQQDDISESMLMRLARGSGAGGLAAPRPVQTFGDGRVHLRPLLTLKKAEIVSALAAAGLPWREDSSNAGGAFFRNRVRREVIPVWTEAAQRDAMAGAARSRALLEEDDAALETWVDELAAIDARRRLVLTVLAGKPRAVLRRALHRWLLAQRRELKISSQAFEALLAAVAAGKPTRHSLGPERFGVIKDGHLQLVKSRKPRRNFQRSAN